VQRNIEIKKHTSKISSFAPTLKHKESISRLSDALGLYKEDAAIPLIQMSTMLDSNPPTITDREGKSSNAADATMIAAKDLAMSKK
jgi:hypothetical protein